MFAFNSPRFRRLGRAPDEISDAELIELALCEPRLLRRPLLVTGDGHVLVGGAAVASAPAEDDPG